MRERQRFVLGFDRAWTPPASAASLINRTPGAGTDHMSQVNAKSSSLTYCLILSRILNGQFSHSCLASLLAYTEPSWNMTSVLCAFGWLYSQHKVFYYQMKYYQTFEWSFIVKWSIPQHLNALRTWMGDLIWNCHNQQVIAYDASKRKFRQQKKQTYREIWNNLVVCSEKNQFGYWTELTYIISSLAKRSRVLQIWKTKGFHVHGE